MKRGMFLCIEGQDGTGKATQHALLADRLTEEGLDHTEFSIPRYGEPSAELVELYLHGEFGDPTKLDPRLASLPYAIDRLAAAPDILSALDSDKIVLADRFTASNMAHQGAKFTDRQARLDFFKWVERLESDIMHIPQPDYYFVLHLPAAIAQQRMLEKTLDGHENDLAYQEQAEQTYLALTQTYPDSFILIECMDGERAKPPEEIHNEVWEKVQQLATND